MAVGQLAEKERSVKECRVFWWPRLKWGRKKEQLSTFSAIISDGFMFCFQLKHQALSHLALPPSMPPAVHWSIRLEGRALDWLEQVQWVVNTGQTPPANQN